MEHGPPPPVGGRGVVPCSVFPVPGRYQGVAVESVNRFGPELVLLAAAGIIVLVDVAFVTVREQAARAKAMGLALLALGGTMASIG